ncbi:MULTISPECIES: transposase [Kribbella]|uniref:transposase n=1 Tax=Kribbella TaxID=182639 RepID=UPI0013050BF7
MTNPLERVNKEIKRRTDVVGAFPKPRRTTPPRRTGARRTHDEWQVSERRYLSEGSWYPSIPDQQPRRWRLRNHGVVSTTR